MKKLTADQMTSDYMRIRDAVQEKEEQIKKLKVIQNKIADSMLELCEEQNIDSLKTAAGTVTRRVVSNFWTSDWEQMHRFIKDNDALHLLEKRIHNGNMKEFLADNPDVTPVGLQAKNRYSISVRKPTPK
jgi:tRNA nucleotidyltransferase (CCA-adding enzyme)|tara:strand:- start:174 stop:563 length:390 start_codon:yes stop_codon:yes gene_type:complete